MNKIKTKKLSWMLERRKTLSFGYKEVRVEFVSLDLPNRNPLFLSYLRFLAISPPSPPRPQITISNLISSHPRLLSPIKFVISLDSNQTYRI